MGFFDFLKKPADKKELTEQLEIFLNELEPFLDQQKKKEERILNPYVEHHKSDINQLVLALNEKLDALSKAESKNKEIPDRVRHILDGNRQIFLQKTISLLEQIKLPSDLDNIPMFTEKFDNFMTEFDKSVAKSHEVISQFFPKEAAAISLNIRELDKKVKDLQKDFKNSNLPAISNLMTRAKAAQNSLLSKENLESEIKLLKESIFKLSEENLKRNNDLDQLKQSAEYKRYTEKIEEKQVLEKELKKYEHEVIHSFSEVESALRKYENMSSNPIAKKYLEDPVSALFLEKELGIVHILDSIKTAIDSGELILKDKKRDKVRREVSSMDHAYFNQLLDSHNKISELLNKINQEISTSSILKNLGYLEEEIKSLEGKISNFNSEISRLEKSLRESENNETIISLEKELKNVLHKDIKIKIQI